MRALAFYLFYRMAVHVLPLLVGVSVIVFAVVRLIPGDAVDVMNDRMPIEQRELIRLQYGLDEPIWTQYALWLGQALQGNLGTSLRSGRPVAVEIGNVASASLELGLFGALIGIGIGLPAGILAAIHHNRPADSLLRAVTYVSISVPEFWLGAVLILMLGIGLGLFPISGYESIFIDPARALRTGAMPAFALGLIMAGFLARVTRSAMLEVMHQDYVIVARSKGLPPRTVLARHALSNAAPAIVTVIALQFAFLISGSIVIEEVFVRPGLGRLLVRSIFQRDYAVVQAITLLYTTIFVVASLAADVLRAAIDPRLRQA